MNPLFSLRTVWQLLVICFVTLPLTSCMMPFLSGEVAMSADQLTERLAKRFPLDKSVAGLLDITLAQPRVMLSETENRFATEFQVRVKLVLSNKTSSGTLRISGRPDYAPETRGLYLRDAKVDSIRMDNMPDALSAALAKAASSLAREHMEDKPLHTFKPEEFTKYGITYTPERISVKGDQLVLALKRS